MQSTNVVQKYTYVFCLFYGQTAIFGWAFCNLCPKRDFGVFAQGTCIPLAIFMIPYKFAVALLRMYVTWETSYLLFVDDFIPRVVDTIAHWRERERLNYAQWQKNLRQFGSWKVSLGATDLCWKKWMNYWCERERKSQPSPQKSAKLIQSCFEQWKDSHCRNWARFSWGYLLDWF